jgi:Zn-dependent protease
MPDSAWVVQAVTSVVLLVLSLTVHEFSHAWMAWRLGDDTAARAGRLTLNPIPHIDLFGTILLPLMGAPIGWAKPVPTDVSRVRRGINMATADILISAAGPTSNLLFAMTCAVVLGSLARFAPGVLDAQGVAVLLDRLMLINAALFVFNLLPIPPLDGGHVAGNLVPHRFRGYWDQFARYAPFILLGLILIGRGVPYLYLPIRFVYGAVRQIAFAIA